jgi:hypothetical protein
MAVSGIRPIRSRNNVGELVVRLGVPLLDEYLAIPHNYTLARV